MTAVPFSVELVRADFPALSQKIHDQRLVYLDNASTTQLPEVVIEAVARLGRAGRASVHRGVHAWSERASELYENARGTVQRFLNAPQAREIVFVKSATEGLNLIAKSLGGLLLRAGDEVVLSGMEHHANLLPWQTLCRERGAQLRVIPVTAAGELELAAVESALGERTRLLTVTHVSNALGTINPIREIAALCRQRGIPVVVDGAQAAAHLPIDVRELGCDFYVFSGHKLFAPGGTGALYGRADWLERMPPFLLGGDMVERVSFQATTFAGLPRKFEAGSPALEGAVGLAAALDYLTRFDRQLLARHESGLLVHALERLGAIPGVRIVGSPSQRSSIVSFILDGVHAHDLGTWLDRQGVAVRTGHHCAEPLMQHLGISGTVRASVALYNDLADVEALVEGVAGARAFFLR